MSRPLFTASFWLDTAERAIKTAALARGRHRRSVHDRPVGAHVDRVIRDRRARHGVASQPRPTGHPLMLVTVLIILAIIALAIWILRR
jgi:hypothetical protein